MRYLKPRNVMSGCAIWGLFYLHQAWDVVGLCKGLGDILRSAPERDPLGPKFCRYIKRVRGRLYSYN